MEKQEKVLVTGGAGFIGSHLVDTLLKRGYDVHILDDLSTGRVENIPAGAVFHKMDIRDKNVGDLFVDERFTSVFHCAAQMNVRRSVVDPLFDARINIVGMLNLLEASRTTGVSHFIFSSSGGAIYGDPVRIPQDEQHPLEPLSPYGVAKLSGEHYLRYYRTWHDMAGISLRYANVYGPRQNPHGEAGVVAIFAEHMLAGRTCAINGDGNQTRDYVFVSDVVEANLLAMHRPQNGAFNIGTGEETSVNALFRLLTPLFDNRAEPPVYGPARVGEQRRSVLSINLAAKKLGWRPRIPLEEGLRLTADWIRSHATTNT